MAISERDMIDSELIDRLRRAGNIWFKNTDLLLLEELIRRYFMQLKRL